MRLRTLLGRRDHLLTALAAPLLLTGSTAAQSPAEIEITGVVRDFKSSHVDMNVVPAPGTGHYAGNVALSLASGLPALTGAGARVTSQWQNDLGYPIAPHLYGRALGRDHVLVVQGPKFSNAPTVDTFDSSLGPYGGGNVGPAPKFLTGSSMPSIALPTGLPFTSEYKRDSGGTVTLNKSFRCEKFELGNGTRLQIDGAVTVVAEELVSIKNKVVIELVPGATFDLYFEKDCMIQDEVEVNVNTADPNRMRVYGLGNADWYIQNDAQFHATVFSPNATLVIHNEGELYGTFTGRQMDLRNDSGYHHDLSDTSAFCGAPIDDTEGAWGAASTGGIDSSGSYDEWFSDQLGLNLAVNHRITLHNNGSGVYEYHDDAFFPVDGRLFGNEGAAHNHYFTFTFSAYFRYDQCAEQFFEFEGADDCWVFINDQLALDLGGILPGSRQMIPIDRLGLLDGQPCRLRLFYAQRQGKQARFHVRTNLELQSSPYDSSVSAGFD